MDKYLNNQKIIIDFNNAKKINLQELKEYFINIFNEGFASNQSPFYYHTILLINCTNLLSNLSFQQTLKNISLELFSNKKIALDININKFINCNDLKITTLNIFSPQSINKKNWEIILKNNKCVLINEDKNELFAISNYINLIHIFLKPTESMYTTYDFNLPATPLSQLINDKLLKNDPSKQLILKYPKGESNDT